jgi:predicted alpha/beta hydrolase family esterase
MPARTVSVLFIQGGGEGAHAEDRALADSLRRELGATFAVHYPRMPTEDDPADAAWKRAIAEEAASSHASIIVGHSIGATILADMLAEGAALPAPGGVFLIAPPYIGAGGWALEGYHFDAARTGGAPPGPRLFFYFGSADETTPIAHADLYARVFPNAVVRRLEGRDHQFGNDLSPVAADIRTLGAG